MANTVQSAKRARQSKKREATNRSKKTQTKTIVKTAVEAIMKKEKEAQAKYVAAVRQLAKAGSQKLLPKARAARKISRLTELAKKVHPEALNFKN